MFRYVAIFLLAITMVIFAKINFSADHLTIEVPGKIIASGNVLLNKENTQIESNHFSLDLTKNVGYFRSKTEIKTNTSKISGNSFMIDLEKNMITGNGNIDFEGARIHAQSNAITIENYERLTLLENVTVKQAGAQVKSDELIYNLKTDSILSNKRVKLIIQQEVL